MRYLTRTVVASMIALSIFLFGFANMAEASAQTYTVQPGDSLWKISSKFDTTINKLRELNNLWTNTLYVGQKLRVPGSTTPTQSYTVQSGDSLWKIAQKTGVTIDAIKSANRLSSNYLWIGQTLAIPSINQTPAKEDPLSHFSQEELELLARTIYAEAWGEPYTGQVAVGAVIMNRIDSNHFPNSIKDVIYQRFAFESVESGYVWRITPNDSAFKAAKESIKGTDPTNGALYFYNPAKVSNPNNWIWTRKVTLIIGDHYFAI